MFWKSKGPSVKICHDVDTAAHFWCGEAVLLEVKNGKGALRWVRGAYDAEDMASAALLLSGKPILQANQPICPTCEGLLATGYGIENINCSELREIADNINAPYSGIHRAVSEIAPILGLLRDGMYVLADCEVFPVDGNGHFFWDVPNDLTHNPATAYQVPRVGDTFGSVRGIPAFMFPSQGTDRFEAGRVQYYQALLSDRARFPRAIAYCAQEFCSVLLDGHHKAAACALDGETVPTLVIMPCTGMGYGRSATNKLIEKDAHFSAIEIPASVFTHEQMKVVRNTMNQWKHKENIQLNRHDIINRKWEEKYRRTAYAYPNVEELVQGAALKIIPLHDSDVEAWLENATDRNAQKLEAAIRHYLRNDKQKARALALRCAKLNSDPDLMKAAFQTLVLFKDDQDIERVFIDWLIDDNDPHSMLRAIADDYWK